MTEALMGTCILAVTTIFVWVCSEYQIYNNEHSAEEKLNATLVVRLAGSTENSILAGSG